MSQLQSEIRGFFNQYLELQWLKNQCKKLFGLIFLGVFSAQAGVCRGEANYISINSQHFLCGCIVNDNSKRFTDLLLV